MDEVWKAQTVLLTTPRHMDSGLFGTYAKCALPKAGILLHLPGEY